MTKEEFIDKTAVANKAIHHFKGLVEKMEQTKLEGVQVYLEFNKKFDFGQRVRVLNKNKELVGYGYVVSIFAEEDYGTIIYEIKKEDKITKTQTDEYFEISKFAVCVEDKEFAELIIEKVF